MGEAVNGVFEGGGAKGIAYVGALQACKQRGVTFEAVAGSSAGAITATLVACGYDADEIEGLMEEALGKFESVPRSLARIRRPSLLSSDELLKWLRKTIAESPNGERGGEGCTFAQLAEGDKGVELYVVTLDLGTGQPVVFGPDEQLTPDSPVAEAVVASSAIPVAFPAARMRFDDGRVHRLVDGGTWSNYPSFVFLDQDFRHRYELGNNERRTVGFILDAPKSSAPAPGSPKPDGGPVALLSDKGSSVEQLKLPGAIMSSPLFLWAVGLLPVLFVVLSMLWLRSELSGTEPVTRFVPPPLQDFVMVASVAVLALTGAAAIVVGLVVLRLGRTLFDSGLVGASSAMGVGPSVPEWVVATEGSTGAGHVVGPTPGDAATFGSHHCPVRIEVPTSLKTLAFDPPGRVRADAIAAGRSATLDQLFDSPERPTPADDGTEPDPARPTSSFARIRSALDERWYRWLALRLVLMVGALFAGTAAAFEVMIDFADRLTWTTPVWMSVVGAAVLVGVWLIADSRLEEAGERPSQVLARVKPRYLVVGAVVAIASAGVIVLAGGDDDVSFFRVLRADAFTGTVDSAERSAPDGNVEVTIRLPEEQLFTEADRPADGEADVGADADADFDVDIEAYFTYYELADQILDPEIVIDEFDNAFDAFGNRLDEFGDPIDEFGNPIDVYGNPVDEFEDPLDEFGDPLDEFGDPVIADATPSGCPPPLVADPVTDPRELFDSTGEPVAISAARSDQFDILLCLVFARVDDPGAVPEVGDPVRIGVNLDGELAFIDDGRLRNDLQNEVLWRLFLGFALLALAVRALRVARRTRATGRVGNHAESAAPAAAERH